MGGFWGLQGASWVPWNGLESLLGGSWEALGGSWGTLGPSCGLQGVLEDSWGALGALLGDSWGALGPSCGSRSIHDVFMKGHDRSLIIFVAKTMVFVRVRDFHVKNIVCF